MGDKGRATHSASAVGPHANITLREVTADNLVAVCKLSDTLTPLHRKMVADNAFSIAEAHFCPKAWFRAIYANEVAVGFLMLHDDPDKPEYFLWRLMIGGPYQKMGFGRRALDLLIHYVQARPGADELVASCEEGEGSPLGFYRRLGFEPNGRRYDGELGLSVKLADWRGGSA